MDKSYQGNTLEPFTLDPFTLPSCGSWPKTRHQFDEPSIWAIKAALAAQRPLLVSGEPGTGKSQLARAAAYQLNRAFVSEVINARSECRDLQYQYDAVTRLGEAQTVGLLGKTGDDLKIHLHHRNYVSPGVLWWTLNWTDAEEQSKTSNKDDCIPQRPPGWQPKDGVVLLIDEIDKADADLPNGLLETLGNGAFTVPCINKHVCIKSNRQIPLVVITTNHERELPSAFLRRCMVLHLKLPEEKGRLIDHLCEIGKIHYENDCSPEVRREAAEQLVKDRIEAKNQSLPAPGQAEYLDILRAVKTIAPENEKQQKEILFKIKAFALVKHPKEHC
jgi:MoxR-like ATPase